MDGELSRLDRIEQMLESSARTIQALSETVAMERQKRSEFQEEMERLTQVERQKRLAFQEEMEFLTRLERSERLAFQQVMQQLFQEAQADQQQLRQAMLGIANLVSSLDEDRPLWLRKLNSIETKLDRLIQNQEP